MAQEQTRPENFCIMPWLHQTISERGRIYPCAFSMESGQPLADDSGIVYSAKDEQAQERAWNSSQMKKMREEFLAGKQPSTCSRCFRLEAFGLQSLREVANRQWGDLAQSKIEQTTGTGYFPFIPLSFDLRFGNFCNLRCRMCSPESSVKMIEEFRTLQPDLSEAYFAETRSFDWFRNPAALQRLLEMAENLKELHFAGGEPFLIPELRNFLQRLSALSAAKNITITFNTNLTAMPMEIYSLWKNFGQVKVFVSLDGVGPVNDYIRTPSRFAHIEKNLQFLDNNHQELGKPLICIHSTIQVYNIFDLPNLIRYCTDSFRNTLPFPILSPLHWPEALAITVLPHSLKEKIQATLLNLIEKESPAWDRLEARCDYANGANKFIRSIQGIVAMALAADHSHLLPELHRHTSILDLSRQQTLGAIAPELAAVLPTSS